MKKQHCCPSGNEWEFEVDRMQSRLPSSVGMGLSARGFEEELCFPEGCRIALRGYGPGEKRRRGERSLVAAGISKIDPGVPMFVRQVGVALLFFFCFGGRDIYVCLLSLLSACFHIFEIGRLPSIYI